MSMSNINHLIFEKSPYLLQHAHNPVNWYAWGEEALHKAKEEDKPIFLSIGYSTCHWCHVMEQESFETDEAAQALNESFIAIKVDREERPDVDAVYMSACQAMTGSGGWPLTILMSADQKPFYAAAYLPLHSRYGSLGLIELLTIISEKWKNNREELLKAGEEIYQHLQRQVMMVTNSQQPSKDLLHAALVQFAQQYNQEFGGFQKAPKFPIPHNLLFLLRYGVLENEKQAITMAEKTLEGMFRGGIYDHIGGGFSRYSTDEKWLVPHFEKMLYDNALLIYVYTEAYQVTGNKLFETVARETIAYVMEELTDDLGGFYCGQDADSEGEEGKYYTFTADEIEKVLGKEESEYFCGWYHVTKEGNFEGKNILTLLDNPNYDSEDDRIIKSKHILYKYRLNRTELHKDNKILTSWNSLMIAALSKASVTFQDQDYLSAAQKAQDFIEGFISKGKDQLFVRWREEAAHEGLLDDYAFYAWALLELYQSSFEVKYLKRAVTIAEKMTASFWDDRNGGFYYYSNDSEQLITQPKEVYDGAIPSGNGAAALVFVRLAQLTAQDKWILYRDRQLCYLAGESLDYPMAHSFSLAAMLEVLYPSTEVICICKEDKTWEELITSFEPYKTINRAVLVKTCDNQEELAELAPFTAAYPIPREGRTYYMCEDGMCSQPVLVK